MGLLERLFGRSESESESETDDGRRQRQSWKTTPEEQVVEYKPPDASDSEYHVPSSVKKAHAELTIAERRADGVVVTLTDIETGDEVVRETVHLGEPTKVDTGRGIWHLEVEERD